MNKKIKWFCGCLLFLYLQGLPCPSYAFKPITHVWVGQQVLDDVTFDGKVTIAPFGEFTVEPEIVDALRNYPYEYRMGNIGPDGFPDVISGQVTVHPGVKNRWQADDWLKWMLQKERSPSSLFQQDIAFAYGYVSHAAADIFSHSYVNSYTGDIFDLSDGEADVELRHVALESYIERRTPPLSAGNPWDAVSVDRTAGFIRDRLIVNPTVIEQYRAVGPTQHLAAMYQIRENLNDLISTIDSASPIDGMNVQARLSKLALAKIPAVTSEIDRLASQLKEACSTICSYSCLLYGLPKCTVKGFSITCERPCLIENPICNPVCDASIEAANKIIQTQLDVLKTSLEILNQLNSISSINPLKMYLVNWRDSVDDAILEYVKTSGRVSQELMKPGGDPFREVRNWADCWLPVFTGTPSQVSVPVCGLKHNIAEVKQNIDRELKKISDQLGDALWIIAPGYAMQQYVMQKINENITTLSVQVVIAVDGRNGTLHNLIQVIQTGSAPETLVNIFSVDNSNKGLLLIPDIVNRVNAEMNLTSDGYFNPEKYNVAYNAVVLSKLALLNANELNRLVKVAGINNGTMYGAQLYNTSQAPFNILFDAVRSIDGNHQWQQFAPPYPRRAGFTDTGWKSLREYGYPFQAYAGGPLKGFRLWQDNQARRSIFKSVFRGPLTPGVETPSLLRLSNILPTNYPYRVCLSNAFPMSEGDNICLFEMISPVLQLLME